MLRVHFCWVWDYSQIKKKNLVDYYNQDSSSSRGLVCDNICRIMHKSGWEWLDRKEVGNDLAGTARRPCHTLCDQLKLVVAERSYNGRIVLKTSVL